MRLGHSSSLDIAGRSPLMSTVSGTSPSSRVTFPSPRRHSRGLLGARLASSGQELAGYTNRNWSRHQCNGLLPLNINKVNTNKVQLRYRMPNRRLYYSVYYSSTPSSLFGVEVTATPQACWGAQDRDVLTGRVGWTD